MFYFTLRIAVVVIFVFVFYKLIMKFIKTDTDMALEKVESENDLIEKVEKISKKRKGTIKVKEAKKKLKKILEE